MRTGCTIYTWPMTFNTYKSGEPKFQKPCNFFVRAASHRSAVSALQNKLLTQGRSASLVLRKEGSKLTLFPCLGPIRMAQDATSFECKPWRWKEGERGVGGGGGGKGTLEEGEKRRTGKGGKQMWELSCMKLKDTSKILPPVMLHGRPSWKSLCLSFCLSAGKADVRRCNL